MTKLSVFLAPFLLLGSFSAAQQEFPRAEVFGGYSFAHNYTGHLDFDWGWTAAPQFNLTRSIGLKADATGYYATPKAGQSVNSYSFLFGPVVSNRVEGSPAGFTPFLHALAGVDRIRASASGSTISDKAFAMAFGGGVDINAIRRISVRLVQIDYLYTKHGTATHQDNIRVTAGVVFRFGGS
jgi:opacity protein-like surface antigen